MELATEIVRPLTFEVWFFGTFPNGLPEGKGIEYARRKFKRDVPKFDEKTIREYWMRWNERPEVIARNQETLLRAIPSKRVLRTWSHACIMSATRDFYGIQVMQVLAKPDMFRHSHVRWQQEFNAHAEKFIENLACMMFDYVVLACAGEARHGPNHVKHYIDGIRRGGSRESVYSEARNFSPRDILTKCISLFRDYSWPSSYGGDKWADIAEAGLKFWTLPRDGFIDHCVDLCHNGGTAFNKSESNIFTMRYTDHHRYQKYLDEKRYITPLDYIKKYGCSLSIYLQRLLIQACRLGVIDHTQWEPLVIKRIVAQLAGIKPPFDNDIWRSVNLDIMYVLEYERIKWGIQLLGKIERVGGGYDDDDEETEECENECEEECEEWDSDNEEPIEPKYTPTPTPPGYKNTTKYDYTTSNNSR